MREPIRQKVFAIIAKELSLSPERIRMASTFEELNIDSLAAVSIVAEIEDEFGIDIPNEIAFGVHSVGEVVSALDAAVPSDNSDSSPS